MVQDDHGFVRWPLSHRSLRITGLSEPGIFGGYHNQSLSTEKRPELDSFLILLVEIQLIVIAVLIGAGKKNLA